MNEFRRLYNINKNTFITKNSKPSNKNTNKSALKCDYCGKKGYKKDRYQKLYPNLVPNKNKDNKLSPISAQKLDFEENISDVLFILYQDQIGSYSNIIIPSIITTSESALSVKYLAESWILDSGTTLYIYYNIDFFDKIAPIIYKIIQDNTSTLPTREIRAITIQLPNSAKAVLELVLYI